MEPVVGVFTTRSQAEEATDRLCERGVELTLLTPGDWKEKVHNVRTEDVEQRGMGATLCGLVGVALGAAGGFELGALAAAALTAGGDPAIATELVGAAILGAGGAVAGIALGRVLETSFCDGLPKDDLYIYEGALRQGRFVVIAYANGTPSAVTVRDVMTRAGAESLDAATRGWWSRRRPGEEKPDRAATASQEVTVATQSASTRH